MRFPSLRSLKKRPSAHRTFFRALALVVGIFACITAFDTRDAQSQIGGDMVGSHPIGIENDTQRQLFYSLLCQCGCPRETLGTCACDVADARRNEMRAALADGKTVEQIQDAFVARYGPQALAVPRDKGVSRLIWSVPLIAIAAAAFGLVLMLRRWRRRSDEDSPETLASPGTPVKRDDYDDKLDQELKELDRE